MRDRVEQNYFAVHPWAETLWELVKMFLINMKNWMIVMSDLSEVCQNPFWTAETSHHSDLSIDFAFGKAIDACALSLDYFGDEHHAQEYLRGRWSRFLTAHDGQLEQLEPQFLCCIGIARTNGWLIKTPQVRGDARHDRRRIDQWPCVVR